MNAAVWSDRRPTPPAKRSNTRLKFAAPMPQNTFPRAFLRGPDTLEQEHWVDLPTSPTIVPERNGNMFILRGIIPGNAKPGLYALDRVEIDDGAAGMAGAKLLRTLKWDELDQFAIIVQPHKPPEGYQIPPVVRRG